MLPAVPFGVLLADAEGEVPGPMLECTWSYAAQVRFWRVLSWLHVCDAAMRATHKCTTSDGHAPSRRYRIRCRAPLRSMRSWSWGPPPRTACLARGGLSVSTGGTAARWTLLRQKKLTDFDHRAVLLAFLTALLGLASVQGDGLQHRHRTQDCYAKVIQHTCLR